MHVVPKAPGRFTLVSRNGNHVAVYGTLQQAASDFRSRFGISYWWGVHVGGEPGRKVVYFSERLGYNVVSHYTGSEHVLRDSNWNIVPLKDVIGACRAAPDSSLVQAPVRGLPVPGTGKVSGSYRFHKRVCTAQLHRLCCDVDPDEPPVRPKLRNRPTAWDDLNRVSCLNNNWKRYRKTQYK